MNVAGPKEKEMYIAAFMDWLHIIWRIRHQFLDVKHNLSIGGFLIDGVSLQRERYALGFNDGDLDAANKQNYRGALKIADFSYQKRKKQAPSKGKRGCDRADGSTME